MRPFMSIKGGCHNNSCVSLRECRVPVMGVGGGRASFSTTDLHEQTDGSLSANSGSPVGAGGGSFGANAQDETPTDCLSGKRENADNATVAPDGLDPQTPANDHNDKPSDSPADYHPSEDDSLQGIRAAYAFKVVPSQIKNLLDPNTHAFRVTPEKGMESTSVAASEKLC